MIDAAVVPLSALLEALGATSLEEIARAERWTLQRSWRARFAREWHDWSEPFRDMDWHVFSYDRVPRLGGGNAVAAFDARSEEQLVIAEDLSNGPMYRCELPASVRYIALRNAWRGDLYVMDEDLRWTFVLTHEEALGPYHVTAPGDEP